MTTTKWIVAAALAGAMMAPTARADEGKDQGASQQKMTIDDLPAPVKATVQKEAKGKQVGSISKMEKEGKTVYEVELMSGGKSQQLSIAANGKVLERKGADEKMEKQDKQDKSGQQGQQPMQPEKPDHGSMQP
jgi:uncharacterized membrane protein YkoI